MRGLSFKASVPKSGDVKLLWEGEVENGTTADATIRPTVLLRDAAGKVLVEIPAGSVKVGRFQKVRHAVILQVDPKVWRLTDVIDERVASVSEPAELYGTSWCPHCKKAREYFRSKGVDYVEHDVEKEPDAMRRLRGLEPSGAVPVAVINGQKVIGFSEALYDKALRGEEAGK